MLKKQQHSDCDACKDHHEFSFPDELLTDFLGGKVTIFAGAGISTESKTVLKHTLFDSIADKLNLRRSSLTFPELMEKFCGQPNGRFKLLKEIKDRFDHIDSFPELNIRAASFHRELGTLFQVRNIVTTNWDTYFERYCKATPFISDPDLAFWEATDRRVLKIHGSIANFGSIVATTSDYKKCQEKLNVGVLGGLLKTILATQTIVFIGYSLTDFDFVAIYNFVKAQMESLHKQSYAVTPASAEGQQFKEAGLIPIITDGTYFLSQIKKHAVAKGLMLDDEIFDAASELLERIRKEHISLHNVTKTPEHPELIYAASYQDGMMHALGRAIEMQGTGQYSQKDRIMEAIRGYSGWQKGKLRQGVYEDVAYIEGYVNGLTYLLTNRKQRKKLRIPLYYAFGANVDLANLSDFIKFIGHQPKAHKASLKRARLWLRKLSNPASIEFHHPPWL